MGHIRYRDKILMKHLNVLHIIVFLSIVCDVHNRLKYALQQADTIKGMLFGLIFLRHVVSCVDSVSSLRLRRSFVYRINVTRELWLISPCMRLMT